MIDSKKLNIYDYVIIVAGISAILFLEIFLHNKFNKFEIVIGFTGLIFLGFLSILFIRSVKQFLVYLYILPFLYLNNAIHYQLKYELFFIIPLALLVVFTILYFATKENKITFKKYYIGSPLLIFVLYFLGEGIHGIISGYKIQYIIFESIHVLLFLSFYLFAYLYKKSDDYINPLKFTFLIFILISIEYILLGYIGTGTRLVTFQASFLPAIAASIFALILYEKNSLRKLLFLFLLLVVILGMFSTMTRSVWVTTLVALIVVIFINLLIKGKLTTSIKIGLLVSVIATSILVVVFIKDQIGEITPDKEIAKVEYRVQSIANPGEDHSFLMRVEFGYYVFQRFIEKPIFGWGLGDFIRYQFLGNNKLENIYPDSIWFYYLWKGGILGFLITIWLFARVINSGLFILKNTTDTKTKIYVLGLLGGFIGMLFLGLLSPALIKYRSNFLFALIFAYFEFEYSKLNNKSIGIKK